jgi:hypothetical protein
MIILPNKFPLNHKKYIKKRNPIGRERIKNKNVILQNKVFGTKEHIPNKMKSNNK